VVDAGGSELTPRARGIRVGIDIGGTFTDIVGLDPDGKVFTMKVSSTADDYARAILEGLRALCREAAISGGDIDEVVHGTTIASNTIIELRGARVGLITTKGFRDTLEIGRLRMPRLYDIAWQKPPVLVERYLRAEVPERINARGEIVVPLDDGETANGLERLLRREKIEALAVCLINSYANPIHEQRVKSVAEQHAPGLPVCISSEVLPEVKEYERTSTTVINAYVMPVIRRYLSALRANFSEFGVTSPLLMMQSNGGIMAAERAENMPIHIIESGPAAGVVASQALARRMGLPNAITFDMGGTTAKASIIENGQVSRAAEYEVAAGITLGSRLLRGAGYLLRVPAIDLAEVGAGGGSIVRVDAGGAIRVGPHSAGASPGPVCYDLGGTEPTITDANVILGYLNPAYLVGGALKLNPRKAHEVFERRIAQPLGLGLAEAAYGAHLVAVSSMMRAIRAVSSERGRDPRQYCLVAFGGNGPLFAGAMAEALGMKRIVIPPAAGLFSSFGLLYSEVEHHYTRTYLRHTTRLDLHELNRVWQEMEKDGRIQLAAEGFSGSRVRIRRWADLRYHGQSFELTVPVAEGALDAPSIAELAEAFGQEHERTYGHRARPDELVEIVNLRLVAQGIPDRPRFPERLDVSPNGSGDAPARRRAYFGRPEGWLDVPIIGRPDLAPRRLGPLIVEEYDATCVIPPRAGAVADEYGNIVIDLDWREQS
jgi:N-methylhydantoinase A